MLTRVKTDQEVVDMRQAGQMLASVLDILRKSVAPGTSSMELAIIAGRELKQLGGKPAFLGYEGFPDVLCVSINDEVVHGIPDPKRVINDGDIVSLDFGVIYGGVIVDSAISIIAGKGDPAKQRLIKTTERAMTSGIDEIKPGVRIGDISAAIQEVLDKAGYGVVRDLVGHGVGHELHEEPNIPNYGSSGTGMALSRGMTVAIEPMATMGGYQVFVDTDRWTVKTLDQSLSAHFEHTVLVTETGHEILTLSA